jgi:hypothetical protein
LLSIDRYLLKGESMSTPSRRTITVPLLLMLALLASVAPFGIDLYLPAFPRMAAGLMRALRPSS